MGMNSRGTKLGMSREKGKIRESYYREVPQCGQRSQSVYKGTIDLMVKGPKEGNRLEEEV